ncbi:MAG: hypothetical protein ACREHV_03060 [Rhizomicrobium sp.]
MLARLFRALQRVFANYYMQSSRKPAAGAPNMAPYGLVMALLDRSQE